MAVFLSSIKLLHRPVAVLAILGLLLVPIGILASSSTSAASIAQPTPAANQALADQQSPWLDPQAAVGGDNGLQLQKISPTYAARTTQTFAQAQAPEQAASLQSLSVTQGGRWTSLPSFPAGTNAYHTIVGPGGKTLLIAGSGNSSTVFAAGTFKAYMWNPTAGLTKTITVPEDMFCAGHMLLSNGKGVAAGGTAAYGPFKGETSLYTFDFTTEKFTKQPSMHHGHWYPTVIGTPGGYALIVGGLNAGGSNAGNTELYYPSTGKITDFAGKQIFPLYPQIFTTADHRYFYTGEGSAISSTGAAPVHAPGFWDPGTNSFSKVSGITNATQRGAGAACRIGDVRNQNIIIMGGGWPATASTNLINLNAATPAYHAGPSLASAKAYVSCVELPDGTLLELNGGTANASAYASHEVSLLASATASAWTPMNSLPTGTGQHRLYHSAAFLMDDGSVVSFGSNPKGTGETRSNTVLRFEPPYLLTGTPRPTLSSVPAAMTYNGTYTLGVSPDVTKVTITTSPSPTHSVDANQKQVTLPVVNGAITLNFNDLQFGRAYVRIFALNAQGVPSIAKWSKIQ